MRLVVEGEEILADPSNPEILLTFQQYCVFDRVRGQLGTM